MLKASLMLRFLPLNGFSSYGHAEIPALKTGETVVESAAQTFALSSEPVDDLATQLTIYSLIVAVYLYYWLKQKT